MFDDLPAKKSDQNFPRVLDSLSISDLQEYIVDLEEEIVRVRSEIERKKASQDAAAAVFRS